MVNLPLELKIMIASVESTVLLLLKPFLSVGNWAKLWCYFWLLCNEGTLKRSNILLSFVDKFQEKNVMLAKKWYLKLLALLETCVPTVRPKLCESPYFNFWSLAQTKVNLI